MEAPVGRNGGRLLGLVRWQAAHAEISAGNGHQQLSVLETAAGMRTGPEPIGIRSCMAGAEAPAIAVAADIVDGRGGIGDRRRNSAGRKRREHVLPELWAVRLAGPGLAVGHRNSCAAAVLLCVDVGTRAAGIPGTDRPARR